MSSATLFTSLFELQKSLNCSPDSWFDAPQGYLLKPDFQREQQKRAFIESGSYKAWGGGLLSTPAFNKRWFVLDQTNLELKYYASGTSLDVCKGRINLKDVESMSFSKVCDAPEHSLDLITADQHYTLVGECAADILRWAHAFQKAKPSLESESEPSTEPSTEPITSETEPTTLANPTALDDSESCAPSWIPDDLVDAYLQNTLAPGEKTRDVPDPMIDACCTIA